MKLRVHPRTTNQDPINHIKFVAKRKPDMVVLHIGTNDLMSGIKTQGRLLEVVDILHRGSDGN